MKKRSSILLNQIYRMIALLLGIALITAHAQTTSGTSQADVVAIAKLTDVERHYWEKKKEGWFWYQDPPIEEIKQQQKFTESRLKVNQVHPDVIKFEQFQKKLEETKKIAIISPTPENIRKYLTLDRMVLDQSEYFAEQMKLAVWTEQKFDGFANGIRPSDPIAMGIFDSNVQNTKSAVVSKLAKSHGLVFVFRNNCPYCHGFAPIVKKFQMETGFNIIPLSTDGSALSEYPQVIKDGGLIRRLGISTVPALILLKPDENKYQVISFGILTLAEIYDRLYGIAAENSQKYRVTKAPLSDLNNLIFK